LGRACFVLAHDDQSGGGDGGIGHGPALGGSSRAGKAVSRTAVNFRFINRS
jgi:hypothetical protein